MVESADVGATFARRVRETRQAAKITQTALAARLGELGVVLDGSAVTRIEKQERSVRLEEAVAIATVLDVPLGSLLTEEDPADVRLRELRQELELQRSRMREAEHEFTQAQLSIVELERVISELEAGRGD